MLNKVARGILNRLGYKLQKNSNLYPDLDPEFYPIYNSCKKFTMTSIERMYGLYQSVNYIEQNKIPGDIVECGVWKGGSSMLAAITLSKRNSLERSFFLYDTFEGMSRPGEKDIDIKGNKVEANWDAVTKSDKLFCYSSEEEVTENMKTQTGYPIEKINLIKGKVEETIPVVLPSKIALLRLDTDWYESTYHELKYLYPLLTKGGVLIIDDYGHWKGARDAVDQYFRENKIMPFLQRIDYTGRLFIKNQD